MTDLNYEQLFRSAFHSKAKYLAKTQRRIVERELLYAEFGAYAIHPDDAEMSSVSVFRGNVAELSTEFQRRQSDDRKRAEALRLELLEMRKLLDKADEEWFTAAAEFFSERLRAKPKK